MGFHASTGSIKVRRHHESDWSVVTDIKGTELGIDVSAGEILNGGSIESIVGSAFQRLTRIC